MTGTWIDGLPRPDHGPGFQQRTCPCAASWVGQPDDRCDWCARRSDRLRADERRLLLDPPWLRSSDGDPRYDALDETDRAVWDRTRGQDRGADSLATYHDRLVRAVETGLLSAAQARRAWERVEGGRYRRYSVTADHVLTPGPAAMSDDRPAVRGNTGSNCPCRVTARVTAHHDDDRLLTCADTPRGNGVTGVTGGSR